MRCSRHVAPSPSALRACRIPVIGRWLWARLHRGRPPMSSGQQEEFLFGEGDAVRLGLPLPDDPLVRDIGMEWGLPVGQRVRITFSPGESFRELSGRLEVAVAPELPLNRHRPLRLRVAGYEFDHTAIKDCVVVEAG